MDYELIFRKNEHKIVERFRDNAFYPIQKVFYSNKQVNKILARQKENTDLFINKYPNSCIVNCIILDVDSKKLADAKKDAIAIRDFMESKGHNTVIVFSTNKGFHVYIEINPYKFDNNKLFKMFVERFIGLYDQEGNINYANLDPANTNAGLKGNIRLIGSIHPVTKKRVEIVEGMFTGNQQLTEWQQVSLEIAKKDLLQEILEEKKRKRNTVSYCYNAGSDYQALIENNDLRDIMPSIYGLDVTVYDGYIMANCPNHNDNHKSLMITKEWYKCLACDSSFQGNINTLIKNGDLKKEDIRSK